MEPFRFFVNPKSSNDMERKTIDRHDEDNEETKNTQAIARQVIDLLRPQIADANVVNSWRIRLS